MSDHESNYYYEWQEQTPDARSFSMRHAILVRIFKLLFLVGAFALIGIVLWFSLIDTRDSRFQLVFSQIEQGEMGSGPTMEHPRFRGLDSQGNPFNVIAKNAQQHDADHWTLNEVSADITLSGQTWVNLLADEAQVDLTVNTLSLLGNVQLFHDAGYEFRTPAATVYIDERVIDGDQPVEMQGPLGLLKAVGFRVEDANKRMLFRQKVKMTLYPGAGNT